MAVSRGTAITKAALDALATLANAKLPGASPAYGFSASGKTWLTELQRIRAAAFAAWGWNGGTARDGITPQLRHQSICSGPWLVGGYSVLDDPASMGGTEQADAGQLYREVAYYFPDTPGVVVTTNNILGTRITQESGIAFNELAPFRGFPGYDTPKSTRFKITIGGTATGRLTMPEGGGLIYTHSTSGGGLGGSFDPHQAAFTYSTNMPGVTWIENRGEWDENTGRYVNAGLFFWVDADVPAGIYTFEATVSGGQWYFGYYGDPLIRGAKFSLQSTAQETVPGVHSTQAIKRIRAAESPTGDGLPFGIWTQYWIANSPGFWDPDPVLGWYGNETWWEASDPGGYWGAKTLPINSTGIGPNKLFPPNEISVFVDAYQDGAAPWPGTETVSPVAPAITYRPPRFPVFRDTETIPTYPYPNDFRISGYTVVDVLVRRAPAENDAGIYMPPADMPVLEVKVGCIRNGAFASFQTATIPENHPEVRIFPFWPCFSGIPLVYQSTERVEVYAVAIGTVGTDSVLLATQSARYPICAAQYNDLETYLGLLPNP